MVKRYLVHHGRLVRDRGVSRGSMLVYPEREWRGRFTSLLEEGKWVIVTYCAAALVILASLLTLVWAIADDGLTRDFAMIIILTMMLGVTISPPMVWYTLLWGIANKPAPGLYEHGFQDHTGFIPYVEMASTDRRTIGRRKRPVVAMHPRYERRSLFGRRVEGPWAIAIDFLGEEGARELEARVMESNWTKMPQT